MQLIFKVTLGPPDFVTMCCTVPNVKLLFMVTVLLEIVPIKDAIATVTSTSMQRGARGEELESLKTVTARLEVQLLTATELFNEICMPFKVR